MYRSWINFFLHASGYAEVPMEHVSMFDEWMSANFASSSSSSSSSQGPMTDDAHRAKIMDELLRAAGKR